MKSDARQFIVENIFFYSFMIVVSLFQDYIIRFAQRLSFETGLLPPFQELHPVNTGAFQVIAAIFFLFLLLRAVDRFRYYK